MSEGYFVAGVVGGAVLVFLIILIASPSGLIEKEKIGNFVCASHDLGEYKDMTEAGGIILWVSCAKEPKQENEVKIRGGGIQQ